MKIIVITGSTRGIGYGLAEAFMERGCTVIVSGREAEGVAAAAGRLQARHGCDRAAGFACDVRSFGQVQALWDSAKARFERIDIWINNAGMSGPQALAWELAPAQVQAVIETNIIGVMYGAKVAAGGMLEQGEGAIYNMEGMGSDGRKHTGLAAYGTTKSAVRYFTESLVEETKDTPLVVGALSPGMVITDMIVDQYKDRPEEWARVKKIFNIIADRVENVAPWLAERVLDNQKTGVRISYSSSLKIMSRMLLSPFRKRNIVN